MQVTHEPFNVTTYPGWSLTKDQERFKLWHSSIQIIVEQTFGRWLNGVLHVSDAEQHADIAVAGYTIG